MWRLWKGINTALRGTQKHFMWILAQGIGLTQNQAKMLLNQLLLLNCCKRLAPSLRQVSIWLCIKYFVIADSLCIFWAHDIFFQNIGFDEILKRKGSAHPFENVQSLLPPNSWLGLYPVPGKASWWTYLIFLCIILVVLTLLESRKNSWDAYMNIVISCIYSISYK